MLRLIVVAFFITLTSSASSQKLTLEGHYTGNSLYILNPVAPEGVGFCSYSVSINGEEIAVEGLQASAYEIDLGKYVKEGDAVKVEIFHAEGCVPKALLTNHPRPNNQLRIFDLEIVPDPDPAENN